MKGSILVTTEKANNFVKSIIPGLKASTVVNLLYRGSKDGWDAKDDFHRLCDKKGPTVTLVKSSADRVSGGFTTVSQGYGDGDFISDAKALVFSVDSEVMFPCIIHDKAVYHHSYLGPIFGNYLGIDDMNRQNGCYCAFTGSEDDDDEYNVSDDGKGNSILTGEGGKAHMFTCVELEVF